MLALEDAITQNNSGALDFIAHTVKGAVGNFGATAAYKAAKDLEMIGKSGNLSAAREAFTILRTELDELARALERVSRELIAEVH